MQTPTQAASVTPLPTAAEIRAAHRYNVLRHYTDKQTSATLRLYKLVKSCRDTGGGDANTGADFESWAYDLRLPGRCKKHQLPTAKNRVPA